MARKLAAAHGLSDNDVIVDRERLEEPKGRCTASRPPWKMSIGTWRPQRIPGRYARLWTGCSVTPDP